MAGSRILESGSCWIGTLCIRCTPI